MRLIIREDLAKSRGKIPGGLAEREGKTAQDFPAQAVAEGIRVELEHTSDRAIAREIALDHLTEDPKYYKLKRIEKAEQQGLFGRPISRGSGTGERPRPRSGGPYIGPRGGKWADPEHTIPWGGEGGGLAGQTSLLDPVGRDVSREEYQRQAVEDIAERQTRALSKFMREAASARDKGDSRAEYQAWSQAKQAGQHAADALERLGKRGQARDMRTSARRADQKMIAAYRQTPEGREIDPDQLRGDIRELIARQAERRRKMGLGKYAKSAVDLDDWLEKAAGQGPYIGPRGGKWADPEHTIPYYQGKRLGKKAFRTEMDRRRDENLVVAGPNTFEHKELIKAAGGIWDRYEKQWLVPSADVRDRLKKYIREKSGGTGQSQSSRAKPKLRPEPESKPEPSESSDAGEATSGPLSPVRERDQTDLFQMTAADQMSLFGHDASAGNLEMAQQRHVLAQTDPVTPEDLETVRRTLRDVLAKVGDLLNRNPAYFDWNPMEPWGREFGRLGFQIEVDFLMSRYPNSLALTREGRSKLEKLNHGELGVFLDALHAIPGRIVPAEMQLKREREAEKEAKRRQLDEVRLKRGKFPVSRGEGNGGRPFRKGQTLEHKRHGWLTVVGAKESYVAEEGMSFGVGDEEGYIYTAYCRRSTENEINRGLHKKVLREALERNDTEVFRLGRKIIINSDLPKPGSEEAAGQPMHDPQGKEYLSTEGKVPPGTSEKFVIERGGKTVWFVKENHLDGDNWAVNNCYHGTSVGWRVTDRALVREVKTLAKERERAEKQWARYEG